MKTAKTRVIVDAKNVFSLEVPDTDDNNALPSLYTKAGEIEEDGVTMIQNILAAPPPMQRTVINDESTISSNFIMDNYMGEVESSMVTKNANICNLDVSVNYISRMLSKFMKEM